MKCGYAMRGHTIRDKYRYYECNGKRQIVRLCDMGNVYLDVVDTRVWEWAKAIIENPENLRKGLNDVQNELQQENQTLLDRLAIIEEQMQIYQKQLDKLLDLYLADEFPKEVLTERKSSLEGMIANLHKEQVDLTSHIRNVIITDDQLGIIEAFCAKIRNGLDQADFNIKRRIVDLLDIRGEIAVENGEKVIYLKCLICPQPVSPLLISPLSSIGVIATISCACRLMVRFR